jgi:hypothetical protein
MASSHIVSKTLENYEKHDPVRNLWKNVLIIALEDLLKNKEKQAMRSVTGENKCLMEKNK